MPLYYETELYHYGVPGMKWGHRKAARLQKRIDRTNRIEDKYRDKTLGKRALNRSKLEKRYDKKIQKAEKKGDQRLIDQRKKNKAASLKDFDTGTKMITKGMEIGRKNKTTVLELKKKSINDPSIKESPAYKKAKQWARTQVMSEAYYGKAMTTLMESAYVGSGRSWTRGFDKSPTSSKTKSEPGYKHKESEHLKRYKEANGINPKRKERFDPTRKY